MNYFKIIKPELKDINAIYTIKIKDINTSKILKEFQLDISKNDDVLALLMIYKLDEESIIEVNGIEYQVVWRTTSGKDILIEV